MAEEKQESRPVEPRGLGEHARGLASEYAHEQGWGLEEENRTALPESPQDTDGGTNYEYGARDFGDEPTNADRFMPEGETAAATASTDDAHDDRTDELNDELTTAPRES